MRVQIGRIVVSVVMAVVAVVGILILLFVTKPFSSLISSDVPQLSVTLYQVHQKQVMAKKVPRKPVVSNPLKRRQGMTQKAVQKVSEKQPDRTKKVAPRRRIIAGSQLKQQIKLIASGPQIYPQKAYARGLEGYVKVKYLVNEKGYVETVTVIEGDDRFGFATAAVQWVNTFRYQPLLEQGKPVAFYVIKPIQYVLD